MYNNTTLGFVIMTDRHPVLHVPVLLRNEINMHPCVHVQTQTFHLEENVLPLF